MLYLLSSACSSPGPSSTPADGTVSDTTDTEPVGADSRVDAADSGVDCAIVGTMTDSTPTDSFPSDTASDAVGADSGPDSGDSDEELGLMCGSCPAGTKDCRSVSRYVQLCVSQYDPL
jgi:hypothetical protein